MEAEQLSRGTQTRAATFKPALQALLRHLLVPQLPKPKIRVALGLELASSGHCKQTRDFGKACDLCRPDVERLGASADCLARTLFTAFRPHPPHVPNMTPEQITDFVLGYLMMRGKPTEDGSLGATLILECHEVGNPANFRLLWSSEHARPDDVIDINRIRIWSHDHLLFDAEFLDSEFGSNRYRVSAFERGTWLDVVSSALMLQLREEGDAIRH